MFTIEKGGSLCVYTPLKVIIVTKDPLALITEQLFKGWQKSTILQVSEFLLIKKILEISGGKYIF